MKARFDRLFPRENAPKWFNRWFLLVVLVLTAAFATGSGLLWGLPTAQSQSGPTQISTRTELQAIATSDLDGDYILTSNISLSGLAWEPIGNVDAPFTGVFDGAGFEISNLDVGGSRDYNCQSALFGTVASGGVVRNVGLRDVSVNNSNQTCRTWDSISSRSGVGSLVGRLLSGARVEASYVIGGTVTGIAHVGGLVGRANGVGTRIVGSFADVDVRGAITSTTQNDFGRGGLVGTLNQGAEARSSYASGDVAPSATNGGGTRWGGFAGHTHESNEGAGNVFSSFSTSIGTSLKQNQGFVGRNTNSILIESYQTLHSDSGKDDYVSDLDLRAATAAIDGFMTWDDDVCPVGTLNEGSLVWDFGAADELPAVSCIDATVQGRSAAITPVLPTAIEISTAAGLQAVANNLGERYILTSNIDLMDLDTGVTRSRWEPIGSLNSPFTGTFDGAGYEISNLYSVGGDVDEQCQAGLFGTVASGGVVRNVGLRDVEVSNGGSACNGWGDLRSSSGVGSLVGRLTGGARVEASYVIGGTVTGLLHVGGLVGRANDVGTTIVGSFADVDVIGLNLVFAPGRGGLVSTVVEGAAVRSSYARGTVGGEGGRPGGLVGELAIDSTGVTGSIISSFSTVTSTTLDDDQFLVGFDSTATITESYQTVRDVAGTAIFHMSEEALEMATAGTAGFMTWDDDVCPVGTPNAGMPVWDFGAADELPIVNCIDAEVQGRSAPAVDPNPPLVSGVRQISTAAHLQAVANNLGDDYILTNDITLTLGQGETVNWTPIGGGDAAGFSGVFDGGGYEISGLRINVANAGCEMGFFGALNGGTVRNLGLRDVDVSSAGSGCEQDSLLVVGALAGSVNGGARIEGSYVVDGMVRSHFGVGGLVGSVVDGVVVGSFTDVEVVGLSGDARTGGLVGQSGGDVQSSYALGSVSGGGLRAGGLLGENFGMIISSFASGSVRDGNGSGGLFGADFAVVTESYQTSRSTEAATYLSLVDLAAATAATAGFGTWDDANCASEATTGADGVVWDFGVADELPRVNCIKAAAQARVAIADPMGPVVPPVDPGVPDGFTGISDAAGLRAIANDLSGNYILTTDITLTLGAGETFNWIPLGTSSDGFSGVLDGGGYEISGLQTSIATNFCEMGLVGWLNGGTVRNLGLRDVYFSSEDSGCEQSGGLAVGALAGYVDDGGRIEGSYVVGGTVRSHGIGGGLAGNLVAGVVEGSFADVAVVGLSGGAITGGLVGQSSENVRSSYALGSVSGGGFIVGGLVGENSGTIISSFATGSVGDGEESGGLFGSNFGTVTESYQTSRFMETATYLNGGVLGSVVASTQGFGTWDDDTCGTAAVVGAGGAVWDFGGANNWPRISCIAASVQERPILVSTAQELRDIANDLSGNYVLTTDITLTLGAGETANWSPFGGSGGGFTGVLDGGGYEISGLRTSRATSFCEMGLFGWIEGGTVRNLGLRDVYFSSEDSGCESESGLAVGALAGFVNEGGRIEGSYVVGGMVRSHRAGGGLVGNLDNGVVEGSFTDVEVVGLGGDAITGGLVGQSFDSVRSSYALGSVSGGGFRVGGLVGYSEGTITSSFATGSVGTGTNSGGLVGSNSGTVTESYQTSDSVEPATYLSLVDLAAVETTATMGFGTWNDDTCGTDAVVGPGGAVWGFGAANELPRVSCIRAEAQPRVAIADPVDPVVVLPDVTVSVAGGGATFSEGETVTLVVTLSSAPVGDTLTVNLTPSSVDDLVEGVDYTLSPESVMFAAGAVDLTESVTLTLNNDDVEEELSRTLSIGYAIIPSSEGTVSGSPLDLVIMDDDTPEITLVVSGGTSSFQAVEGGDDVVVTVRASKTLRSQIELTVSEGSDGTATAGSGFDYTVMPRVFTLAPSGEATVTVDVLTDEVDEVDEFVSLLFAITDAGNSRAIVGSGTVRLRVENVPGPTQISDAAGLRAIANDLSGNYILTANIDLEETDATGARVSWTPLGNSPAFSGVFDGAGYEISGLWANTQLNCRFGLFGFVSGGTVRNVGLRDVYVSDDGSGCGTNVFAAAGGLVGTLRNGRVEASYVVGGTVESNRNVGGLVGRVLSPTGGRTSIIVDSFTDVSVMGVTAATALSDVNAGGLVGEFQSNAEIRSSYVLGDVIGQGNLGGLAGTNAGTIISSFVTGSVPVGGGGFVGSGDGTVTESYQTSDSAETATYLSLVDLAAATAGTAGFGTWDDANCASEATTGAGGAVWDFGAANELPRVSCISAAAQPRVAIADPVDPVVVLPDVTVSVAGGGATFGEGESVSLDVTLSSAPVGDLTVNLSPSSVGGLLEGVDYTLSPESVTFAAGAVDLTESVILTLLDDDTDDADTRALSIAYAIVPSDEGTVVGSPLVLTITDDDLPVVVVLPDVTVSVAGGGATFGEGESVTLDVTLSSAPVGDLTVNLSPSSVDGLLEGMDYTLSPESVTFAAGAVDLTESVILRLLDDEIDDADTRALSIAYAIVPSDEGTVVGSPLVLTVTDDDLTTVVVPPGFTAIRTAAELRDIANDLSGSYILLNGIDLQSANWTPIGSLSAPFTGVLDGAGFEISNLLVTGADVDTNCLAGFFGNIAGGGVVRNLGLRDVNVSNEIGRCNGSFNSRSGALAGSIFTSGRVEASYVVGGTVAGFSDIGGLVGRLDGQGHAVGVAVVNSFADVAVVGWADSLDRGGLVGAILNRSAIRSSYALGDVGGMGSNVGGLAGYFSGSLATVVNSFATGAVSGGQSNGLIGRIDNNPGPITNNYQTSDSAGAYYLSLSALAYATAGTTGFGTWDDANCASEATTGAGGVVWSFGVGELPRISCISAAVQPRVVVPAVFTEISTAAELRAIANDLSGNYILRNDISLLDVNGDATAWSPVGNSADGGFTGVFDGGGYEISGFRTVNAVNTSNCELGFFGYVNGGTVRNLGLRDAYVSQEGNCANLVSKTVGPAGGLIGFLDNGGQVETSYVVDSMVRGVSDTGVLVGRVRASSVLGSFVQRGIIYSIRRCGNFGVLVGWLESGSVRSSFAMGNLNGNTDFQDCFIGGANQPGTSGGLVGEVGENGVIANSVASVTVVFGSGQGLVEARHSAAVIKNSYQTIYSHQSGYILKPDFVDATVATAGFETWDDDVCPAGSVRNGGAPVWDLGTAAGELPVISCISERVAQNSVVPFVTVTGFTHNESFNEGDEESITLFFELDMTPSESITVTLTFDGSTDPNDFTVDRTSVTLTSAGVLVEGPTITIVDDEDSELREDIRFLYEVTGGYGHIALGAPFAIQISDNDTARLIGYTLGDSPVVHDFDEVIELREGDEWVAVRLIANIAGGTTQFVNVSLNGEAGDLLFETRDGTIRTDTSFASPFFNLGATVSTPVFVQTVDDDVAEFVEEFALDCALSGFNSYNAPESGCDSFLSFRVTDDDVPVVTVDTVGGERTFSEESGVIDLGVSIDNAPAAGDVVVTLTPSSDDLVEGVSGDYTLSSTSVTFTAGTTTLTETVTLTLINDEVEEELLRTLSIGYVVGAVETAVPVVAAGSPLELEIMDDDTPEITLVVSGGTGSFQALEGSDVVVRVRASKTLRNPIELTVSDGSGGTATEGVGFDYTVTPRAVTLAPSGVETVTVAVLADDVDEVDEFVSLLFAITSAGASRASVASGTVVLRVEDATVPQLSFNPGSLNLNEGDAVTFTVVSDIAVLRDVTVNVAAVAGDTSLFSISPATGSVTIPAGGTVSNVVTLTSAANSFTGVPETVALRLSRSSGEATLPADDLVVTVIDVDSPTVTVGVASGGATTVDEGDVVTLEVRLTRALAGSSVDVNLAATGLDSGEYTLSRGSVSFAAGATGSDLVEEVTLTLVDDEVEEVVSRELEIGYTVTPSADVQTGLALVLTVMDDDAPVITISSDDNSLNEGEVATLTFTVDKSPRSAVTVSVTVPNQFSSDVSLSDGGLVTFAAGATGAGRTQTLTFTASDDVLDELDELVVLSFVVSSDDSDAAVAAGTSVSITVVDMNVPVLSFNPSSLSLNEGGMVTFMVGSDIAVVEDVVVDVSVVAGDAGHFSISPESVTIPAGGMVSGVVTLVSTDDSVSEPDATVNLGLSLLSGEATLPADGLVVTVMDDDLPTLELVVVSGGGATTVGEDVGTVTLELRLNAAPAVQLEVFLTATGLDTDEYELSPPTVLFSAGATDLTETVTLTLINDELEEVASRMLSIEVDATPSSEVVIVSPLDLTIMDDDTPEITIVSDDNSLNEGQSATLTFTVDKSPRSAVTVTVTHDGGSDASLSDGGVVTFAAGAVGVGRTQTLTFTASNDVLDELDEDVELSFTVSSDDSDADVAAGTSVSITVVDTDVPELNFSTTTLSLTEGGSDVTFTVNSDIAVATDVSLTVALSTGEGNQISISPPSVTIQAGETISGVVTLSATDDSVSEVTKTVAYSVIVTGGAATATVGGDLVVTVMDDDTPNVTVEVAGGGSSFSENHGSPIILNVVLSGTPAGGDVTVNLTLSGLVAGTDYTLSSPSVIFTAGTPTLTQPVTLTLINDELEDESRTLSIAYARTVTGSATANVVDSPLELTITDDDTPVVTVAADEVLLDEGGSTTLTFTVDKSPRSAVTVTVTHDGGSDASLSDGGVVTFPAGATGANRTQTLTFTASDDDLDELSEAVGLTFAVSSDNSGAMVAAGTSVSITVFDTDMPVLSFSRSPLNLTEGSSDVTFTINSDIAVAEDVVLDVAVASGDASQFTISPTSVTIQAGETISGVVTLSATDDGDAEQTAMVNLEVSLSAGATTATPPSNLVVTVLDDDLPTVSVSVSGGTTISENAGTVMLDVTLTNAPSGGPLTVNLMASGLAASEYMLSSTSLTFAAGAPVLTQHVTLTLINDELEEAASRNLEIAYTASPPARAAVGSPLVLTITDDDTPNIAITNSGLTVTEGDEVTFTLTASKIPSSAVVVNVAASNAGGANLSDTSVTFTSGNLTHTITLMTNADSTDEATQNVNVTFSLGSRGNSGVTLAGGTTASRQVEVLDAPNVIVRVANSGSATVSENVGTVTLEVVADNAPFGGPLVVNLALPNLRAGDSLSTTSVTFMPGDSGADLVKSVTLTLMDNNMEEAGRNLTITPSVDVPTRGTVGSALSLTVNDDDTPVVTVSGGKNSLDEGEQTTVTISTSGKVPSDDLTVTILGTNADLSVTTTTVTLRAGQLSQTVMFTAVADSINEDTDSVPVTFSLNAGTSGATLASGSGSRTFTITDAPNFTLTTMGGVTTFAEHTVITLVITQDVMLPTNGVNVILTVTSDDLVVNEDYTLSSPSATFTAGNPPAIEQITLTLINDEIEDLETRTLSIAYALDNPTRGSVGSPLVLTITDDDTPTITVSETGITLAEGGDTTVTFTVDKTPINPLTISITGVDADGDGNADVSVSPPSVTLEEGQLSQDVTFTAIADALDELDEVASLVFSLADGSNSGAVFAAGDSNLNITVEDGTTPVLTYSRDPLAYVEGATETWRVVSDIALAEAVTLDIARQGGGNSPHFTISPTTVTIPVGERLSGLVTLSPIQDEDPEPSTTETLIASTSSTADLDVSALATGLTVNVADDDAPTVTVTAGGTSFSEGVGTITVTVSLTSSPLEEVVVDLSNPGGGTLSSGEYTFPSTTRFTFAPGTSILSRTAILTIRDDEVEEMDETVIVDYDLFSPPSSAEVSGDGSLELTIMDDDTPEISVSAARTTLEEGEQTTVTFTVDKSPSGGVTVTVGNSRSSDASLSRTTLTFPAGTAVGTTRTLTFMALDDNLDELDEDVTLTFALTAPNSGATFASGDNSLDITVEDTDVPQLSFSTTRLTLTEGDSDVTFTVTSNIAVAANVVVTVSVSSGDGTQFSIPQPVVSIPAGMTTSGVLTLSATDDGDAEVTELVGLTVVVTGGAATARVPASDLVVTVIDDDTPIVTVSVASGGTSFSENDGANNRVIMLDVALSSTPAGGNVIVNLTPSGLGGSEYRLSPSSVTFTPSDTGAGLTEQVTLTLINDEIEEAASRTLSIALATTTTGEATANAGAALVLTITDDDAPEVTVSGGSAPVGEGEQTTLTFRASKTPINPLTINIGGSNAEGSVSATSVTLRAGQLVQTVTFRALADNLDEQETVVGLTFALDTGTSSGAALATGDDSLDITVEDTTVPVVTVAALRAEESESGVLTLTFEVDITPLTPLNLAVDIGTNGSATVGEDYVAGSISASTVTLTTAGAAGRQMITVDLLGDDVVEATETIEFVVTLSLPLDADDATIGNTGTTRMVVLAEVLDDDVPNLTVTVTGTELVEGAEVSTVTLTPDAVLPFDLTVGVGFGGGTASGSDVEFERSVILAAGEPSVSFTVRALSDLEDEPEDEVLLLVFMADVDGRAAVFADGEGDLITADAPVEFTVVNVPPPSTGLVLPEFTRVVLSAVGGTVGGSLRARLDYEVGGGALYPTSVGWRVASGSDVFTLGTPITRELSDGSYEFSVEVIFEAVGTGEIEVFVRQIGAPTEELRVIGTVTSITPRPSAPPAPFVPPPDPPGVAPAGAVRPSTGADVVEELASGDEVVVEIPAGASNDFLRVEVADVPSSALNALPELPSGVQILTVAPVLDIDLMDSNNDEVRRVSRPTRVCLPLSVADYEQVANPALLRVITYHEGASGWDVLNSVYEVDTEQLCAYTSRFSVFAIGLASPQVLLNEILLPSTGDGGVLGLWSVAGLVLLGALLIAAGVLVAVRRRVSGVARS